MGVRHRLCPHAALLRLGFRGQAAGVSEVFPQRVRGPAVFTAAISNFAWNFVVTSAEPTLECGLLPFGRFAAFMLLSVLAFLFVKYIVPETKGETLEEIEAVMTRSDTEVKVVITRKVMRLQIDTPLLDVNHNRTTATRPQ